MAIAGAPSRSPRPKQGHGGPPLTARFKDQRGFTLVELLIGAVVMLLVTGTTLTMLERSFKPGPGVTDRATRVSEARQTLERITRELRQSYAVKDAGSTRLDFYTYVRDAATGKARQREVIYDCDGGQCLRTEGPATSPCISDCEAQSSVKVATGLGNVDIFAFDPSSIDPEYVQVKFVFSVERQSHQVVLQDGVDLRNATDYSS